MSAFLSGFAEAVVTRLLADGHLEIEAGRTREVIQFVGTQLSGASDGASLISTLSAALIQAEGVVELYVDDVELKELVTDLPPDVAQGGRP